MPTVVRSLRPLIISMMWAIKVVHGNRSSRQIGARLESYYISFDVKKEDSDQVYIHLCLNQYLSCMSASASFEKRHDDLYRMR